MSRKYLATLSGVALASLVAFLWLGGGPARAQRALTDPPQAPEITGTPGSPSATTTIDGQQLPPPP